MDYNDFNLWLHEAAPGERVVYATGTLPRGVQAAARNAYKLGLVELFQRKGRATKFNKTERYVNDRHREYLYDYVAIRVTEKTADLLRERA